VAHTVSPRFGSGTAELVALSAHLAAACAAVGEPPGTLKKKDLQQWHDAVRQENRVQCDFIRDIFGNLFRSSPPLRFPEESTVATLTRSIYAERAFGRLPILADALEEAGCTDTEILSHCRNPGPHVRGCWVVDLLLGKE
jgi:hypothetical protein